MSTGNFAESNVEQAALASPEIFGYTVERGSNIGHSHIKERRMRHPVTVAAGGTLGD